MRNSVPLPDLLMASGVLPALKLMIVPVVVNEAVLTKKFSSLLEEVMLVATMPARVVPALRRAPPVVMFNVPVVIEMVPLSVILTLL